MQALFTGALGDFLGAESFMTEEEKDAVTTILWCTRNRKEIQAAIDLKLIFPNLKEEKILFDDWAETRPTTPWKPGDKFQAIGMKHELNLKCGLNLSQEEMDAINDYSLDATLQRIFKGHRWQSSRFTTRGRADWLDISKFNLPKRYVVIHPWSDAEINGREFDDRDWNHIFKFLESKNIMGVVVNKSNRYPPKHPRLIDLTNQDTLKELWPIVAGAEYCILCASSIACFATKIFPKGRIWLKAGFDFLFTDWATYFYHGPFINPNDVVFRNLSVLDTVSNEQAKMLDQGTITLL